MSSKKSHLLSAITSIFITVFVLIFCQILVADKSTYPKTTLDDDWTLTVNESTFENVTLSEFYKSYPTSLKRDDHITLKRTLPDIGTLPTPVLLFRSRYTTLNVYVDNEKIFSYGENLYITEKFLGKMYHVITLPTDYADKELVFDMYVGENEAFETLDAPILGAHPDITSSYVNENVIVLATGIFTFVFGISFFFIALIFVSFVPEVTSLLLGSLFCINQGIWLLTFYNLLPTLIYTDFETEIEYFTLYLTVPFCYILLYYIANLKNDRIYRAMMCVGFGVSGVQYFIHYVFNIHLRVTVSLYHISAILGFGVLAYFAAKTHKKKNLSASATVQLTGLVFFAIGEMMMLIIYILSKLHINTIESANRIMICSGNLIFVICQLSTYLIYITESYAKKQENISLSHLAYADGLTNLANRAKSDQLMVELNKATDDYCIISIDLNGLKTVNDKFGHPTGDRYIKDFSKVMTNTFNDNKCFCARIGGDEFIVVIRDAEGRDINALIDRMNSALNVMNALYTEYKRSISTGFAFRHECKEADSHKVYLLADQRMYNNKRRMHEEDGIPTRL